MNTPLFFYASSVGRATLDQGEGGGNPFASALIESLARDRLTLRVLTEDMADLTVSKSRGFQRPDLPSAVNLPDFPIKPKHSTQLYVALVLVFSDYSASGGAASLPGAKYDAYRVAAALKGVGFETQRLIDPTREHLGTLLQAFASRSGSAEMALIYATGHGAHVAGETFLLPGDYPLLDQGLSLESYALRVSELASVTRAKHLNLVCYGGCRNNPFSRR
jgi:hypothetical protein